MRRRGGFDHDFANETGVVVERVIRQLSGGSMACFEVSWSIAMASG